jgi:RNA polymerase sigma-70 factor (ECF subfamily)
MSAHDPLSNAGETLRSLYAYVAYDPAAGTPIAWMIGIAKNCLADARPDAARHSDADVEQLVDSKEDFTTGVAERADLHAAVARLDERDRELLALRYGADLSARQIGRLLEMRTNAVEVALHRALGRLRRSLESGGAA